MDIVAYLRLLRRHWKLIVAATMLGALVGVATTLTSNGTTTGRTYYKATHTLFLDSSGSGGDAIRPLYTNLDQIAVLVTTGDVPKLVADELGGDAREWTTHVFTVTNGSTYTLDITCAMPNADEAVTCSDTFAEKLVDNIVEREQTRFDSERGNALKRVDDVLAQITDLDQQIAAKAPNADLLQQQRISLSNAYRLAYEKVQLLATQGGPSNALSTLERAESEPISKSEYDNRIARGQLGENHVRADFNGQNGTIATSGTDSNRFSGPVSRGILGALLGLLAGIGLSVLADHVDRRLRTREEVEAAFAMPVLAEIPALNHAQQKEADILSASAPLSRTAEAYRSVRSSLMFQRATEREPAEDHEAMVLLVTSAGPKEGKTTSSANLAAVFAEAGSKVLVVNCDFRRATLNQYFNLENEPRRVFETDVAGAWVVTDVISGSARINPASVVEEQRRVVQSARQRFDVVILDTPPLLTTNDATELIDVADAVLLIARSGISTSDGALRARELLARIGAPVSGVVLVGSAATPNDYYYYYSRGKHAVTLADAPVVDPSPPDAIFGPDPTPVVDPPDARAPDPGPRPVL